MWNSPKTTTQNHQAKFQQKFSEDKKISSVHQSNFDQQITKNGINQNNISDQNLIKNAEIIFENNDSIPKLSRQTNIKKTKSPKTIQHHQIKFQQKQKVPTIHQSKFDQQITKNGISNQNDISDHEKSIKNAEIIFENDADSMPKSSKPTILKKTKSLIENLENKDLDLSSRKTFLAMKRKLILKRIESEIKVNEAQISIHQKTEEVQDAILKNELLKMQTLQEKMLNRPKKQFQKKQEKMCE